MQDHFKYLHLKSFSIAQITFDLDKFYPCTCQIFENLLLGQLCPFLLEKAVPRGNMVGATILWPPLRKSISSLVIIKKIQNTFLARHCHATMSRLVTHLIHYSYLVLMSCPNPNPSLNYNLLHVWVRPRECGLYLSPGSRLYHFLSHITWHNLPMLIIQL